MDAAEGNGINPEAAQKQGWGEDPLDLEKCIRPSNAA